MWKADAQEALGFRGNLFRRASIADARFADQGAPAGIATRFSVCRSVHHAVAMVERGAIARYARSRQRADSAAQSPAAIALFHADRNVALAESRTCRITPATRPSGT